MMNQSPENYGRDSKETLRVLKRFLFHILTSILLVYVISYVVLDVYPPYEASLWHLMNENPFQYGGREFHVPQEWSAEVNRYLGLSMRIPRSRKEGIGPYIRFTSQNEVRSYQTEKEITAELREQAAWMEEEGKYQKLTIVRFPLPGEISRCIQGVEKERPSYILVRCRANGVVFIYSFYGPAEYLPIFEEIIRKAKKIKLVEELDLFRD